MRFSRRRLRTRGGHPRTAALATGQLTVVACTALLSAGCGMADEVIDGMPASEGAPLGATLQSIAQPPSDEPPLVVNGKQRAYLDGLRAGGVHSSSELVALSIGSYVCQARAANQSDQAVWDFVLPMVRGDVRDSQAATAAPPSGEVNSVTADYIRIATEKLC